ncbi:fibronectin type III domain-containing protein [Curtobacterium sp. VKM Ac-1393]|uniref:fibronectin type III domain-containing protein n=1 Tax=Curtobacterium sp. VKM Ac-1393 TaxID=2783814 RepID=UPI00188D8625|nr:fibronectin type III domain-containing protein [Curtobacterium sp. VKM Ac-1393]MBF4609569.1 fibronectin type III domain-containing protein [Curtobacterium sp. VKM Ac-1393]
MFKSMLTIAAAAALVVGGALPAHAAPTPSTPSAPASVKVTGSGGDADVTWGAPRTGPRVTGYTVTVTPADSQPNKGVDRLPATARWDHFGALRIGTTYTFAVRAVAAKRTGPAATVQFTAKAAAPTPQSLFALDAQGSVVRFATEGTAPSTTVAPNGAGYTADDRGDVFVPSADRTSIVMYPASGGAARTVATGLHLTADLRSDVAGNLYWADSVSGSVTMLPIDGTAPRVVAEFGTVQYSKHAFAVSRNGIVTAYNNSPFGARVEQRTAAGVTTVRTVTYQGVYPFIGALQSDDTGNLYLSVTQDGPGGRFPWLQVKAGASAATRFSTDDAFEYGATNSTSLRLLQSAAWCSEADERSGNCSIDRSLARELVAGADGSQQTLPVTGITAGSRGSNVGASTEAGDVFIDINRAPSAGLWRVPAAGGAAQQVAAAQYTRLLVI